MKENKQQKLKNISKKAIGWIILVTIMIMAFAILSVQQIEELKSITPESARALENNQAEITITNLDKETLEVLPGAVFKLERQQTIISEGNWETTYVLISEGTTNDEGKVSFVVENPTWGGFFWGTSSSNYRVTQITPPSGYKLLENSFNLTGKTERVRAAA